MNKKMMICKSCGAEIAKTAKRCPKCGARQHQVALTFAYLIAIITVFAVIFIIVKSVNSPNKSVQTNNEAISSRQTSNTLSKSSNTGLKDIYSDGIITVQFIKKYDIYQGEFCFDLRATNKSSKSISLNLQNVYINNTMVTVGGGSSTPILAGKNEDCIFFGKHEGTGTSTANEIKKIGFKILVMDENSSVLETTKNVEVTF